MSKHAVIVGAGISGLSLAWKLRRAGQKVTLIEKETRPGGWVQTLKIDDYLFDLGPRSFRSEGDGQATLQLIEELGLTSSLIQAAPNARKRFLFTDGKLQQLPTGLLSLFTSPLTRPLIRSLLTEWRVKPGHGDESIESFVTRRLGKKAAHTLFDPMTLGVYAGDIRKLSMRSCFPSLYQWEQSQGSLTKGLLRNRQSGALYSLKGGMGQLIEALQQQLDIDMRLGTTVSAVDNQSVHLASGEQIPADRIYLTVPSHIACGLLSDYAPTTSRLLRGIPFESVTVACCGFLLPKLRQEGFGYLVPTLDNESILGAVWDSCAFPQQNQRPTQTRISIMFRGERPGCKTLVQDALRRHMGIDALPDVLHIHVAKQAIPQYVVGHANSLLVLNSELRRTLPNVTLLGSSLYGVSLSACVAQTGF